MLEFLVAFDLTQNDPAKLEIAARLRQETTLSTKEIGARVPFGDFQNGEHETSRPLEAQPGIRSGPSATRVLKNANT
jgi:hypothetical protein